MTAKQFEVIEFYSNSIVSFSVVQTFALIYFVSGDNNFMEELSERHFVSFVVFVVVSVMLGLMVRAMLVFRKMILQDAVPEVDGKLLARIYMGKVAVTVIFGLPAVVIFLYKAIP